MSSVEHAGNVQSVHLYPVKSCHEATIDGMAPVVLHVGPTGFEEYGVRDRDYVVVDEALWLQVTARGWGDAAVSRAVRHPEDRRLVTVGVDVRPDHIVLNAPNVGHFELGTATVQDASGRVLDVFGKEFPCLDQGDDAAAFFTRVLGRAVRLVRANRATPRLLRPQYRREDASNQVAGADGYPFLLANQHSLDASHERNGLALGLATIRRFRPNIVVDARDLPPYAEDYWRKVMIGLVAAYIAKACARCPMPNVDPDTGDFDPKKGLAVLRGRKGELGGEPVIVFGQNLNHIYVPGQAIAVGDALSVLKRADERNFALAGE